jgi:hypothetical protein
VQKLDWIILAICLVLTWPTPGLGEPIFVLIERGFTALARNTRLSLAVIGALTVLARVALLPWLPVPQPKVHDEFSYLLAADTFAHGRLANPPHPLWVFFDTFHVIQHPTYASMYPPAQGMVLAFGKLLGQPWIGVMLSVAAMSMAITWMLQGWMSAEWALLGGVLVLSQFGLFSYWMNSYWGGAVAATGAAVVLGALPRIWERQRPRDAIILALGAGMLATSRPVEGFIFCIPPGIALLWWTLRPQAPVRDVRVKKVLAPALTILVCVVGFVAYYNWRVTGSPIVFPHFIEQRQDITTAVFLWQHDKPPITYSNPQFNDFYNQFMPGLYHASWPAAEGQLEWKGTEFWQFFFGPALSIPFLALPWALKDRRNWLLLGQVVLSSLGLWVVVYYHAHYAAPLMTAVFLLMMQCMRLLCGFRFLGRAIGVALTRLIVLFSLSIGPVYFVHTYISQSNVFSDWFHRHALFSLIVTVVALGSVRLISSLALKVPAQRSRVISFCEFILFAGIAVQAAAIQGNLYPDDYPFVDDLAESFRRPIEQQLNAMPGEHLVLVRYSKDHNPGEEYVYNDADIDHAKTVWAREIPGRDLGPLLNYFRNRDVWVYEPDVDDESVSPYSDQKSQP